MCREACKLKLRCCPPLLGHEITYPHESQIALCIIYKIVPELVRSFDLELVDPDREWTITNRWLQNVKNVQTMVAVRNTE